MQLVKLERIHSKPLWRAQSPALMHGFAESTQIRITVRPPTSSVTETLETATSQADFGKTPTRIKMVTATEDSTHPLITGGFVITGCDHTRDVSSASVFVYAISKRRANHGSSR